MYFIVYVPAWGKVSKHSEQKLQKAS